VEVHDHTERERIGRLLTEVRVTRTVLDADTARVGLKRGIIDVVRLRAERAH